MAGTSSWIALSKNRPRVRHGETWAGMGRLVDRGLVTSPLAVSDELSARRDGLLSWVDGRPMIFPWPSREMLDHVVRINGRFLLLDKSKSRPGADPHVIALAVVLQERGLFGRAPVVAAADGALARAVVVGPEAASTYSNVKKFLQRVSGVKAILRFDSRDKFITFSIAPIILLQKLFGYTISKNYAQLHSSSVCSIQGDENAAHTNDGVGPQPRSHLVFHVYKDVKTAQRGRRLRPPLS